MVTLASEQIYLLIRRQAVGFTHAQSYLAFTSDLVKKSAVTTYPAGLPCLYLKT